MSFSIGHVALTVSDIEQTIQFYSDCFGFVKSEEFFISEKNLTISFIEKEGVVLELFSFSDTEPLPKYREELDSDLKTIGTKHLAFTVDNINVFYEKLKRMNIKFAVNISEFENGKKYFYIKDPDGILVEVMET